MIHRAPPSPETLAAALADWRLARIPALPGRTNHLRAGVLVPLAWSGGRLETVLTLRARALRQHGGEPSWPGGKPEADDRDLAHTALREAHEEIGARDAVVLGRLSSVPLFTSDHRLEPFVARVRLDQLAPEPGEVAALLRLDLDALLDAPHTDAIAYRFGGVDRLSPVWRIDQARRRDGAAAAPLPDHVQLIYGATAHVLLELLEVVARAWDRPVPALRSGRYGWDDVLPGHAQPEPQPDLGAGRDTT